MKEILALIFFFICNSSCQKPGTAPMTTVSTVNQYSFLALGDSYTIGESVPASENFPNQVQQLMQGKTVRGDFISLLPPRIIAKTGWTTDELETGILAADLAEPLKDSYDFVSLLIGVNNQYRGRPVSAYRPEFEALLRKAIRFAGNRPDRVIVLSIPDWGVTPFAEGRDRAQISAAIDAYNAANKEISFQYGVQYINITPWTREAAVDLSLLAPDGLHPSGKEYKRWATAVSEFFLSKI